KEHSPRSDRRRTTSSLRRSYRKKRPPILFRSTQAGLRGSNRQRETLALPHRSTKQLLDKEQRLTDARRNRGRLHPRRGDEKGHHRLRNNLRQYHNRQETKVSEVQQITDGQEARRISFGRRHIIPLSHRRATRQK